MTFQFQFSALIPDFFLINKKNSAFLGPGKTTISGTNFYNRLPMLNFFLSHSERITTNLYIK